MDVSGKTKITGIFGCPIEHTLSPAMHNAAFQALGLDMCYVPFLVEPASLENAVQSIRTLNMLGINTTVPHKENVIPFLDHVNDEAAFIGAVNTITNTGGILTGYNTDGRGFMRSLQEAEIDVTDKKVLVIGAGGASRAVCYYLSEKASSLSLIDIDREKASSLVRDLSKIRSNVHLLDNIDTNVKPDILVNATPLGLKQNDPLPVSRQMLTPEMAVCDLIYKKTPLLMEAEKAGSKTLNGAGMLLWQGILAFELWTGVKPPVDLMRKELLSRIS
ncbi:MAG: shikimate dehydrogenase [Nitrospira sp.]|nr:shikimate dehydrogenase [bacterium]MBL7049640.1 shikimate dehydrogenase [Nitrospira sp.]